LVYPHVYRDVPEVWNSGLLVAGIRFWNTEKLLSLGLKGLMLWKLMA